ncbi:VanW family protein [Microtetraspora sp. NBRC 16547]|uniref:VanW family protein n=1 Tax=Microtetraspora sp. NBRC 16547 TaxID=3030993 RepID=UPI0024A0307A|nr:VanW family protein [Microtetraspora sp. NBRC 16547]GLX02456.1 vanomycin resistance protein VanB [Microtetraspora sp. NBRC 16547]
MRNAEASIDPPTDPFAAGSPPDLPRKHPVRPASGALPPGVSADILGVGSPESTPKGQPPGVLPPAAPPAVAPWPVPDRKVRQEPPPVPVPVPVPVPEPEPEPRRRLLMFGLPAVLVLLLLAYLVPAALMAGRVLPGTTVLGVDIGGQTQAEAVRILEKRLSSLARSPVIVKRGLERASVNPEQAGLSFDAEATVRQVAEGFPGPMEVWNALTTGREVPPKITVDKARLDMAVARDVAVVFASPAQEGDVRFRGLTPVPTYPHAGRMIDHAQVAADIQRAYLSQDAMVEVTVRADEPQVTRAEVRRALAWARRAVGAPVTVTSEKGSVGIPPEVLAANLSFTVDAKRELRPVFDAAKALTGLEDQLIDPRRLPRDATFTITDGKPVMVRAKAGQVLDTERLSADVVKALTSGSRTVRVFLTDGRPGVTDAEAQRMGITERVGHFTTSFACCLPRVTNIKTVARALDGHLVAPGETFSLNQIIGRREPSAGYTGGAVATRIDGTAGVDVAGITQFATTMFNAAMRAGMEDVAHTPHDHYVWQYPAGMDAAVSYPDPDLQWKNDSPYGVLVRTSATDTSVSVELWSTRRFEVEFTDPVRSKHVNPPVRTESGPGCVRSAGQAGFTVEVTRTLRQGDKVAGRQTFTTTYEPHTTVVCASAD